MLYRRKISLQSWKPYVLQTSLQLRHHAARIGTETNSLRRCPCLENEKQDKKSSLIRLKRRSLADISYNRVALHLHDSFFLIERERERNTYNTEVD